MPSAIVDSAQPRQILKKKKRKAFMIQNLNSFAVFIRWDGKKTVTADLLDNENCGITIGIGGSLSVTEGMIDRTNDSEVWAIAEPADPANSGYLNFIEM